MPGWSPLDLLPGAWVALLALSLAAALRHGFDPVPAHAWAVWGAVLALLFAPALLGGRVQLPLGCLAEVAPYSGLSPGVRPPGNLFQGDLVFQIAPWLERVRAAYAAGEWPLWNHLAGAGEPLLGNPQSQALQPLALLALAFPVAAAAGVICALRVLAALVFSFLWMRRQGLGEPAALAGSLAFGFGGFLQLWLGWPLAGVAAWHPMVLYALARVDEVGGRRDRLLLALSLTGLLLAGHPESELHALALAAAFGVSRVLARPAGRRLGLLRSWVLPGIVAIGLAAPVLLPASAALPAGQRSVLLGARHARLAPESPLDPWRDPRRRREGLRASGRRLLPIAAPNVFGNNRFGRYWGPHNILDDAAGFTGAAVLAAALAGLASLRGGRRLRGERLMQGAALVSLVVLARPPGMVQALDALPLLRDSLQFHDRIALVLNLALAYLAACAWERAGRRELRKAPVAVAALALATLLTWAYLTHPDPADPGALAGLRRASLAVQLAALAMATAAALAATAVPSPAALANESRSPIVPGSGDPSPTPTKLLGFSPAAPETGGRPLPSLAAPTRSPAALRPSDRPESASVDPDRPAARPGPPALRARWAGWLLATAVAGELLFIHLPANPATPRELYYPRLPPIARMAERLAPGERMAGLGRAMRPNIASVHGLADARSTNPIKPAAYLEAISRIVPHPHRVADGFLHPADPLWDLLGVRYVVTAPRVRLSAPLELVLRRGRAWIYRRPAALPRLFLPASAMPCAGPSWAPCLAEIRDFAAVAAVRTLPPGSPAGAWTAPKPAADLELVEVGATRLIARLASPPAPSPPSPPTGSHRLLASSIYQDGGWRALAGGRLLPTTLANGPFLAAWLPGEPAGPHELDLLHRPPGFLPGMALAALALALALAAWIPTPLSPARTRPTKVLTGSRRSPAGAHRATSARADNGSVPAPLLASAGSCER